jgi:hypothetical protein
MFRLSGGRIWHIADKRALDIFLQRGHFDPDVVQFTNQD